MGHYLEGHSTSPRVMIPATRAFHQTAHSGAHGFRSHRLRSLLMLRKYYRIGANIPSFQTAIVCQPNRKNTKRRSADELLYPGSHRGPYFVLGAPHRITKFVLIFCWSFTLRWNAMLRSDAGL